MLKPFAAAVFVASALSACNLTANSAFPIVESITAAPAQVTDLATPFVITANMRAGAIDVSGALPAGITRPEGFKILTDKTAEYRPATLPTSPVYVPLQLIGGSGFGVSGPTQTQVVYLQFEPIPNGLAFKGYRTILPSAAP